MLRSLPPVAAAGHPTLVIFYRNDPGQPATDDRYARFGVTEWEDLEGAVRLAVDSGAEDVVLVGASMGGAIATSFMLESELADRVVALVFDAPALDLGAMVRERAGETNLPVLPVRVPNTLTAWSMWLAGARFDLDWGDLDYLDRADELDVPILLFHGDEDGTVPVSIGDRLAEERPDLVRYVRIDDADHVRAWNVDPDRYEAELAAFLAGLD
jgi:pimeloyl-ACP methyl ester carboxylesterase